MQLATGRIKRLIVSMPPRHGKSELCSKYFPAWYLGTYPDRRFMLAAYEADFAAKWGRDARNILEAHAPSVFGVRVSDDSSAANRWDVADRDGGMNTAGIGGPMTGRGAHILAIDDPTKNAEEALSPTIRDKHWDWYQSTAFTRLEPGGSVLIIMTRWHEDDLAGRVIARAQEAGDSEPWEVLTLPAIAEEHEYIDGKLFRHEGAALWPERFSCDELAKKRAAMDPYWWLALYQQRPGQLGRSEWPDSYFGEHLWFDEWPRDMRIKTMALDPSKGKDAKKGDYSAFVMLGRSREGLLYVDADLERRPAEKIVQDGVRLYREFRPDGFAIETNQFQELLAAEFKREFFAQGELFPQLYHFDNRVKKEVRIRALGALLQARIVRIKRGGRGNQLLLQQLKEFPLGKHDDGPDAFEMAARLMSELRAGPVDSLGNATHL